MLSPGSLSDVAPPRPGRGVGADRLPRPAGLPAEAEAIPPPSPADLVVRYSHLVKYVVGRLRVSVPGLFDRDDALQVGTLGLLRAIEGYRPQSATSFESYAIVRIRGAILDAVRSIDAVGRVGREAGRAIQAAITDLGQELGRPPTENEAAARLRVSVRRYRQRLLVASIVTVPLEDDDGGAGDDDQTLADRIADPGAVDPAEAVARGEASASLGREIARLGNQAKTVLGLYYRDELTYKEIGSVLGVSESRVCQIHAEAVLLLRARLLTGEPEPAPRRPGRRAGPRPAGRPVARRSRRSSAAACDEAAAACA